MSVIWLVKTPDGWVADFDECSEKERVRAVFGTTKIPTAFTRRAPAREVRNAIRLNWPGHKVRFVESDVYSRASA